MKISVSITASLWYVDESRANFWKIFQTMGMEQHYCGVFYETFVAGIANLMPAGTLVPSEGFWGACANFEYS